MSIEEPKYKVDTLTRKGRAVTRLRFDTFEDLEEFFLDKLIGSDLMIGQASKVIGKTLLIWERNPKQKED
jgi:hypothetical protein